jgi:hypothetical protein
LGGAGGGDGLVDVAGRSPSWRPPVAAVVHRTRAGQARQVAAGKQTWMAGRPLLAVCSHQVVLVGTTAAQAGALGLAGLVAIGASWRGQGSARDPRAGG